MFTKISALFVIIIGGIVWLGKGKFTLVNIMYAMKLPN